uniref:LysR family transcriptional regulator n=1 Tax=Paractinoplanes polyasparticus TaxID=2856853 RepID=UPI0027E19B66|nr:LysR substrate-binding domain-containing protein [Actinoplanes polyasparticus]
MSSQVKALEHELGTTLFDRSGRTARLTEAGAAALPHARAALDAVADLRQAVDEVRGLVRGQLTVGMVTGCEVKPLFAALADFHRDHPAIELDLVEDNSDRLVAGVRVSTVDVALVGVAGEPPPNLESQIIVSEGLVASRGLGLAALSESMATAFPRLRAVAIDGVGVAALLALVWRPRLSPVVAALLPHLRRAFG